MSTSNPWKRLSTRVVYQNNWIKVREDSVIRPDGNPGIYSVVETRIATGVVALDQDNNLYLVGQFRYPMDEYSWEIIEGGTEEGETPLEAIRRELKEEAGLIASDWSQLGPELHLSNCYSAERALLYLARGLTPCSSSPDGTEVLAVKKVPLAEAVRMVRDGEIKDSMSVIGIMRVSGG